MAAGDQTRLAYPANRAAAHRQPAAAVANPAAGRSADRRSAQCAFCPGIQRRSAGGHRGLVQACRSGRQGSGAGAAGRGDAGSLCAATGHPGGAGANGATRLVGAGGRRRSQARPGRSAQRHGAPVAARIGWRMNGQRTQISRPGARCGVFRQTLVQVFVTRAFIIPQTGQTPTRLQPPLVVAGGFAGRAVGAAVAGPGQLAERGGVEGQRSARLARSGARHLARRLGAAGARRRGGQPRRHRAARHLALDYRSGQSLARPTAGADRLAQGLAAAAADQHPARLVADHRGAAPGGGRARCPLAGHAAAIGARRAGHSLEYRCATGTGAIHLAWPAPRIGRGADADRGAGADRSAGCGIPPECGGAHRQLYPEHHRAGRRCASRSAKQQRAPVVAGQRGLERSGPAVSRHRPGGAWQRSGDGESAVAPRTSRG